MNEAGKTRYAPGYDLFKLIVAVILTILLIFLLLRESRRSAPLALETPIPTATMQPSVTPTATFTTEPTVTATIVTPTAVPAVTASTATPTQSAEEAAGTPIVEALPTKTSYPPSDPGDCPSNPSRLQGGDTVRVVSWLYFRTGPGLYFDIQHKNKPGTEMEVIGGPVCTVRGDDPPRAYLWWNLRMKDGREGWSAEAPLNFPDYFLEPIR